MSRAFAPDAQNDEATGLACCRASLRTGAVLDPGLPSSTREKLEALASTLPELFGTLDSGSLDRIAERTAPDDVGQPLGELLLLSEGHIHLVQPLASQPGVALLAVSSLASSVGLVLSDFHARVAALEGA